MTPYLILFALLGLLAGYWMGHANANLEIARECRLLGSFYVGDTVFKCGEIIDTAKPFRLEPPPRPPRAPESPIPGA